MENLERNNKNKNNKKLYVIFNYKMTNWIYKSCINASKNSREALAVLVVTVVVIMEIVKHKVV
jgi:hypothetical protein